MQRYCSVRPRMPWAWCVLVLLQAAPVGHAQTKETRRFDVLVDGKQAGAYQMTFREQANGALSVTHQADIRVTTLLIATYTYAFMGSELWKDGQLLQWDSSANDNGDRIVTSGRRESNAFRLRVNSMERMVRPGFLLNSYVFRPAGQPHNQRQRLVEADTGKELQGVVDCAGREERTVAGQKQSCDHFRVRGEVQADVWYDAQGRLVHQESVEDGHRTVLQLKAVDR